MPVKHTTVDGKPAFKWGDRGKPYTYEANNPSSKKRAKKRALKQGEAIAYREGNEFDPSGETEKKVNKSFEIMKFNDDKQLVFGWASVARNEKGQVPLEWQNDKLDIYQMEKAVYNFVEKYSTTKEMHKKQTPKGVLIESCLFTPEKKKAIGLSKDDTKEGWWVGFKILDPLVYKKVKEGKYKMFSIEGKGVRRNKKKERNKRE